MTDYRDEEEQTDDLIDAWRERVQGLTQAEIEAIKHGKTVQPLDDSGSRPAAAQAA